MRENWARLVVFITGILVVVLSMMFARVQNPDKPPVEKSEQVSEGERVYQKQGCAGCHSIKGEGGLTVVVNKYNDEELRAWITGAETLEGKMSRSIMNLKSRYQKLPEEDIDALVVYLRSQ